MAHSGCIIITFKIMDKYEKQTKEELVKDLLSEIGENTEREGLKGTPERVVRMWSEIFRGYDPAQKPKMSLFNNGQDGIIVNQMITDTGSFYSHCEHHMVPFFGKYWFAYIPSPKGKILGLSKVARIVGYYSAKLQIQERLVFEIVEELWDCLGKENPPLGMALVMEGAHLCKQMRGVRIQGKMRTSELRGVFLNEVSTRQEFTQQIK